MPLIESERLTAHMTVLINMYLLAKLASAIVFNIYSIPI